jgi:GTPase SAR1 family protein
VVPEPEDYARPKNATFCELMRSHCEALNRRMHVVNLDPAAEHFSYPVAADIRELISLEDVMAEMKLGPNGGLIYCMEYLVDNIDWLEDELEEIGPDEYIIFDCPGQIELYSHVPAMATVIGALQRLGYRVCASYLLDSQFVADVAKFVSGVLCCLSAMTALELPHVNVLSKCDLLPSRHALDEFLEAVFVATLTGHEAASAALQVAKPQNTSAPDGLGSGPSASASSALAPESPGRCPGRSGSANLLNRAALARSYES